MASFFEDLWNSVFTPGPTSSLLLATNVSFAALQIVLTICLFVTRSVHFIALSVLSSGLWWSVNWFAKEVKAAQEAQARREGSEKKPSTGAYGASGASGTSSAGRVVPGSGRAPSRDLIDSGDDTETEHVVETQQQQQWRGKRDIGGVTKTAIGAESQVKNDATPSAATLTTSTAVKSASGDSTTVKQRRSLAESTGDLSTDSEWEKVDNDS